MHFDPFLALKSFFTSGQFGEQQSNASSAVGLDCWITCKTLVRFICMFIMQLNGGAFILMLTFAKRKPIGQGDSFICICVVKRTKLCSVRAITQKLFKSLQCSLPYSGLLWLLTKFYHISSLKMPFVWQSLPSKINTFFVYIHSLHLLRPLYLYKNMYSNMQSEQWKSNSMSQLLLCYSTK